jgi:ABC-2 type transport system ATP-binding protein
MASVTVAASGQRQGVPETQEYHQGLPGRAAPGSSEVHHRGLPGGAAPGSAEIPAVVLSDVTVRFKGQTKPSVDRLSLTIPTGELFGLLGPNGSGKTTTISVIVGLLTPGSGHAEVFGGDPGSLATKRTIGVLIQKTAVYPKMSGWDNLFFHAGLYGYTDDDRRAVVDAALKLANLEQVAGQLVGRYSGGMARRLAIARTLLHSPRLIVLDEPTLGVDVSERAELWQYFRRLPAAGTTVLLTTNVLEEAEALCDRVAILREGRLVTGEPASPQYLREHYGAMVITVTAQAGPEARQQGMAALRAIPELTQLQDTTTDDRTGEFVIEATASVQHKITGQLVGLLGSHGVVILDVDKRKPTLEEVFRLLTTGPPKAAP